jgi:hypothetical protein
MDILYYSNYCKHSQKIIQTLVKNNLIDKISCICIDKRIRENGQVLITLENGNKVTLPPNVHSVPSLLLLNQNFRLIMGDDILQHFHKDMKKQSITNKSVETEPMGYFLNNSSGGTNIMSEKFTDYSMTPDELSAKGKGDSRNLYNYVSVSNENLFINTPEDKYKPDKVSNDVTLDQLQQKRMDEINVNNPNILPNPPPII